MVRRPLEHDAFPDVLRRAVAGDREAAELLFVDLQPRLLRFLRSTDRSIADDVAADTWYSIARGLASFRGDLDGFRAWAFTIARRRLADHRRLTARRPITTGDVESVEPRAAAPDAADTAIARLSGQEAADQISRVLPPDQAEVLLLRVLADLDVSAVAEVMGRTSNWVRVTQHRAVRRLTDSLGSDVMQTIDPTISMA